MNIKAERIEQIIQIINRNLLLAFSGQTSGMAPLELKKLQKIETSVFGHDKFAFEMVHFIKTAKDQQFEGTIAQTWDKIFMRGLETLLVECAIVRDDIERDCFVSRVYSWFTEKLAERRGLPRVTATGRFAELVQTVSSYGNSNHTMKGLERFVAEAEHGMKAGATQRQTRLFDFDQAVDEAPDSPTIRMPSPTSRLGTRTSGDFVNSGFPEIMKSPKDYRSFLPKIPGVEVNYGLVHNKPETEAEKNIHELWIARRRQEAFEWKTQQHLALVMDRLDLHKSRLESEALRRYESSANLIDTHARPRTAPDTIMATDRSSRPSTSSRCYSPSGKRPASGKKKHLIEARAEFVRSLRLGSESPEPGVRSRPVSAVSPTAMDSDTNDDDIQRQQRAHRQQIEESDENEMEDEGAVLPPPDEERQRTQD